MTTRVVHPVHIVLDAGRVSDTASLRAALDAALAQSGATRRTVVGNGPGAVREATVEWRIPPSVTVTDADRQRIEATVGASVQRAGPPAPPAARRGGHSIVVDDVDDDDIDVNGNVVMARAFLPLLPEQVGPTAELAATQMPGGPPSTGEFGFIFQTVHGDLRLGALSYPGPVLSDFALPPPRSIALVSGGERRVSLDANSAFRLSWDSDGSDPAATLRRFFGAILMAQAKAKSPHTEHDLISNEEYARGVATTVENRVQQLVGQLPTTTFAFLRLDVDDANYLLVLDGDPGAPWIKAGLSMRLYTLAASTGLPLLQRYGTGQGTGAGTATAGSGDGTKDGAGAADKDGGGGVGDGSGDGAQARDGGAGEESGEGGGPATSEQVGPDGRPATGPPAILRLEGAGTGTQMFPLGPLGGIAPQQDCTAFQGEPSLDELGPAGAPLRAAMQQIAVDMAMQPCSFLGSFLIDVGTFLAARALQVGSASWLSTGRPQGAPKAVQGNLGAMTFIPSASPQIQLMRHLAGVVPRLHALANAYRGVLRERPTLIHGVWHGAFVSWDRQFGAELVSTVGYGVGQLFGYTSSVLFGELLRTSAGTIESALDALPRSAPVFHAQVLPLLSRVADLTAWRDRLRDTEIAMLTGRRPWTSVPEVQVRLLSGLGGAGSGGGDAAAKANAWRKSVASAGQALAGTSTDHARTGDGEEIGQVVRTSDGLRVRDDAGRLSTQEDLEQRIILTRGTAEEIEPLVKHIEDLPEVVARMRAGGVAGVESELRAMLKRMREHNREITEESDADPWYGFTKSAISEDIPHATVPYSSYHLGGIHLLAHQEIGEFFRGDRFYPIGIDAVFDSVLGRRALSGAAIFIGLVFISVVCAPLGVVLGAAYAVHQLVEAYDKKHVYDALDNPELVLTRAEVEMELFAAWFGAVLAFLPIGAKVFGVLGKLGGAAAAVEGEAAAAGGAAARRVAAVEAGEVGAAASTLDEAGAAAGGARTELVEQVQQDLLAHFIAELVKAEALNKAIETVMTPIMRNLQHELETTASVGGMQHALLMIVARQQGEQ
jgi:hypothetical protein